MFQHWCWLSLASQVVAEHQSHFFTQLVSSALLGPIAPEYLKGLNFNGLLRCLSREVTLNFMLGPMHKWLPWRKLAKIRYSDSARMSPIAGFCRGLLLILAFGGLCWSCFGQTVSEVFGAWRVANSNPLVGDFEVEFTDISRFDEMLQSQVANRAARAFEAARDSAAKQGRAPLKLSDNIEDEIKRELAPLVKQGFYSTSVSLRLVSASEIRFRAELKFTSLIQKDGVSDPAIQSFEFERIGDIFVVRNSQTRQAITVQDISNITNSQVSGYDVLTPYFDRLNSVWTDYPPHFRALEVGASELAIINEKYARVRSRVGSGFFVVDCDPIASYCPLLVRTQDSAGKLQSEIEGSDLAQIYNGIWKPFKIVKRVYTSDLDAGTVEVEAITKILKHSSAFPTNEALKLPLDGIQVVIDGRISNPISYETVGMSSEQLRSHFFRPLTAEEKADLERQAASPLPRQPTPLRANPKLIQSAGGWWLVGTVSVSVALAIFFVARRIRKSAR